VLSRCGELPRVRASAGRRRALLRQGERLPCGAAVSLRARCARFLLCASSPATVRMRGALRAPLKPVQKVVTGGQGGDRGATGASDSRAGDRSAGH
jgi:hypothetical protein